MKVQRQLQQKKFKLIFALGRWQLESRRKTETSAVMFSDLSCPFD
jgi:hypothetical protein